MDREKFVTYKLNCEWRWLLRLLFKRCFEI